MNPISKWTLTAVISLLALPYALIAAALIHDVIRPAEDTQIIWVCEFDGDGNCGSAPSDISIHLPWREW